MDNSLIVEGLDIRELNDDDLLERLQSLGFNPGPITATTREVYQRKLARILRNEEFVESEGNEDDLPDDDYPKSPVLSTSFESGYSGSPSINIDDLRRRPLSRFEDDKWSEGSPSFLHKSWSPDDIVTQVQPPPQEEEKPYMSSTTMAVVIFVVLAFAFLVYYNMESAPQTPFS